MKLFRATFILLYICVVVSALFNDGGPATDRKCGNAYLPADPDRPTKVAKDTVVQPKPALSKNNLQKFCESMREIEELREYQLEQLKMSFHTDSLPTTLSSLTDPSLKPFLSPKVRAVVDAFPLQAKAILEKHQLESDEFNRMLEKTKSSSAFRTKVEREMKRISK